MFFSLDSFNWNMAYAFKFNQVLKILGKERAATYLKEAFLSLLTDNSREVQKKIFSILHHIIGNLFLWNTHRSWKCLIIHVRAYKDFIANSNLCVSLFSHLFKKTIFSTLVNMLKTDITQILPDSMFGIIYMKCTEICR